MRSAADRDAVAKACSVGDHMMQSCREMNLAYTERTGKPSRSSEADYAAGANRVAVIALEHMGYTTTAAKAAIVRYREGLATTSRAL